MRVLREIRIPDVFTLLNCTSGFLGIVHLLSNGFDNTVIHYVLFSALMDGLDGFTSRKFGGSSIGKDLDSLADLVSFGLLPSLTLEVLGHIYVAIMFFLASVLRLALFNVLNVKDFMGLPTTASALLLMCLITLGFPYFWTTALALSILMVSDVKYVKVRDNRVLAFVGFVAISCFVVDFSIFVFTVLLLVYVFSPILMFLKKSIR
jgi:CDP-diacylglycerol--serine O-phosphatidyltransferase